MVSPESVTPQPSKDRLKEKEVDTGDDSTLFSPYGSAEEHDLGSPRDDEADPEMSIDESSTMSFITDVDGPRESYRTTMLPACDSTEEPESEAGVVSLLLPSSEANEESKLGAVDDSMQLLSALNNADDLKNENDADLSQSPSEDPKMETIIESKTKYFSPAAAKEPQLGAVDDSKQLLLALNNAEDENDAENESKTKYASPSAAIGSPGEASSSSAFQPPSQTFAVATRSLLRRLEESYRSMSPSTMLNPVTARSYSITSPVAVPNSAAEPVALDDGTEVNDAPLDTALDAPLEVPVGSNESISSDKSEDRGTKMPPVVLRMPNTAFGIAMGLAGNAIMWRTAYNSQFISDRINTDAVNKVFWIAAIFVGIGVAVAYMYKAITAFELVKQEYLNPIRIHFMNGPHLVLLMLTLSIPEDVGVNVVIVRIMWGIAGLAQLCITQFVYEKWMFSRSANISMARPQFLLSTVGWFLLSVLGQQANIEEAWGLALPAFCFGTGTMMYLLVTASIFGRLHKDRACKGAPSLTLLIAPPAVGVVAIDGFDNDPDKFSIVAEMVLGWCLVLVLLLIKLGPKISSRPVVLGIYWAYVFPLSALANACIRYADVRGSAASQVMAAIFMGVSVITLLVVFVRMAYHCWECSHNRADWDDPLVKRYEPDAMPSERRVVADNRDVETAVSPVSSSLPGSND